jgi:hypothetical protein
MIKGLASAYVDDQLNVTCGNLIQISQRRAGRLAANRPRTARPLVRGTLR